MSKPTESPLRSIDPKRAEFLAALYHAGHLDLFDQTQEHVRDSMQAWEYWVRDVRAIVKQRDEARAA